MAFKPRVYLAGPVADVDDGGHGWRNYVTEEFGTQFEFLNPLDKYDVPAGDVEIVHNEPTAEDEITVDALVTADRVMVEMSDAVLVGWERAVSVGTPMEAMFAHELGTPVVVWDRDQQLRSPWWKYHADLISTRLKRCLDGIDDLVNRGVVTDGGRDDLLYVTVTSSTGNWYEVYPGDDPGTYDLRAVDHLPPDLDVGRDDLQAKLDEGEWEIVYDGVREAPDERDRDRDPELVTDGGTVTVCPDCDTPQVYERQTKSPPWRCGQCGHEFDAPVERPARHQGGNVQPDTDDGVDLTELVDSAFVDIEPGDRLRLSLVGREDYTSAHYVESVRDRTAWDVPFADDWVDGDVVFGLGGLDETTTRHRAVVESDGTVWLYRILADGTEEPIAEVERVERDGRIVLSSQLQYLVDDGADMPEGDDSWQDLYDEEGGAA